MVGLHRATVLKGKRRVDSLQVTYASPNAGATAGAECHARELQLLLLLSMAEWAMLEDIRGQFIQWLSGLILPLWRIFRGL